MPYISKNNDRREKLRNGYPALSAGELNYQIFYFVKHNRLVYAEDDAFITFKLKCFVDNFLGENRNYQRYNDMTGCLIRCAREINRRLNNPEELEYFHGNMLLRILDEYDNEIAKYEDIKIQENGDVE